MLWFPDHEGSCFPMGISFYMCRSNWKRYQLPWSLAKSRAGKCRLVIICGCKRVYFEGKFALSAVLKLELILN